MRGVVGVAFVLTIWLAGPRAYAVAKTRLTGASMGPPVALSRVGIDSVPTWLRGPVFEQVLADLQPILQRTIDFHIILLETESN